MNNLELNAVYNELVFTEYEQDDFSYVENDFSYIDIPADDDFDIEGEIK